MATSLTMRETVRHMVDLLPDGELPIAAHVLQGLLALHGAEKKGPPITDAESPNLDDAGTQLESEGGTAGEILTREELRHLGLR